MKPNLSIIVPCYNVAPWLARCVSGMKSDIPLEILLVDDGSTDETPALCDALAAADSRIRVLHQENAGVSDARNAGLSDARGEYVWFVDGDDAIVPGAIDFLWATAQGEKPDLIGFSCQRFLPDGREELWAYPHPAGLYTGEELEKLRLDAICFANVLDYSKSRMGSAWSLLCRREFLLEQGLRFAPTQEILNEDYLFVLQAMYAAEKVRILHQVCYHYLLRSGSLSTAPRPRMWERKQALFDAFCRAVPEHGGEAGIRLRNFYIDCLYNCFVEACLVSPTPRDAIAPTRILLKDRRLHRYLRANCRRIRGLRPACICALMALRAAGPMVRLYRRCKPETRNVT